MAENLLGRIARVKHEMVADPDKINGPGEGIECPASFNAGVIEGMAVAVELLRLAQTREQDNFGKMV